MNTAGLSSPQQAMLPTEIITAIEECSFLKSIPLWAVTLIGGLFITVLSFILILSVYGRFFKLYLYTALAPVPLSTFAGSPSQNVGRSFLKSYCAVCLEGAVIVLACIIFSLFAASPPAVDPGAAAVTMVWSYIGELVFNMLVLVGTVKMADRMVREMMGL
jgi:FtsH-binding integral membrane protein